MEGGRLSLLTSPVRPRLKLFVPPIERSWLFRVPRTAARELWTIHRCSRREVQVRRVRHRWGHCADSVRSYRRKEEQPQFSFEGAASSVSVARQGRGQRNVRDSSSTALLERRDGRGSQATLSVPTLAFKTRTGPNPLFNQTRSMTMCIPTTGAGLRQATRLAERSSQPIVRTSTNRPMPFDVIIARLRAADSERAG